MENQKTNRKNLARQESISTNWIRTIAILSPVHPVGKELSEAECQELKASFEQNFLKIGHFPYFELENGYYAVYNIAFDVAKNNAFNHAADSFVFAKIHWNKEGDAVFTLEYWKHFCKTINGKEQITTYKIKGSQVLGGSFENVQAKDDFLARLNPPFKSFIPNSLVEQMAAVNNVVEDYAQRHPDVDIFEFFNESISEQKTGKHHWITRAQLYGRWNKNYGKSVENKTINDNEPCTSETTVKKSNGLAVQTYEPLKMSDIGKNIRTYAIVPEEEGGLFKKPKNPILNAIKDIWPYITVDEYFNGQKNKSFLIINVSLDFIKHLAAKYKITYFYFGYEDVTYLWRINDPKYPNAFFVNNYEKIGQPARLRNFSDLPNDYWIVGWRNRLKINIPIAAIDDISTKIQANIDKYFNGDSSIVDWCIKHVGLAAHLRQRRLYQFD
ncbi:MAG: hypothetical protein J6T98_11485 [Salinivirgaceae bacterium]|nr:hypothetical protein [Salinivirgaceae bacterium]